MKYDEECCDLQCKHLKEVFVTENTNNTERYICCKLFSAKLDSYTEKLHIRCNNCIIFQKKEEIKELEKELSTVPFVSGIEQKEIEKILKNPECNIIVETETIEI